MAKEWEESKHPRDDDGKFTDGAGVSKLEKANEIYSDTLEEDSKRLNRREISDSETFKSGEFDEQAFAVVRDIPYEQIRADSGWLFGQGKTDSTLYKILHSKGYDKPPKIISKQKIDELIKQGYTPIFRGMKYLGDSVPSGAEQYKSGEMFVGRGAFGHGVYFATRNDMASKYAVDRTGKVGSFLTGVLDKSAKIISADDAKKLSEDLQSKATSKEHIAIFSDIGKVAALYGYDAIKATDDIMVILNRGKTIIEE